MKTLRAVSAALFFLTAISFGQSHPGLHLVKEIIIGGSGGWDYLTVDGVSRRLYVTHSDKVEVLDADSLTVVGEVPNGHGLHGVAIAQGTGHGFATNGGTSTVSMFDLKTLSVIKEIPTAKKPDAIVYDSVSRRVFAMCGDGECATVIEPVSGTAIDSIPLGGGPEFAVADGKGHVYVNIEDKSELVAINSLTAKVIARWSIAPGEEPSGLSMDALHRRLFSVCRNKLLVVSDADKGKVIATLPIGSGVDGCAFDPTTETVFTSNGEGTMTVVHENTPESYTVAENAATRRGARTVALDPITHAVFTATASFGPMPPPAAGGMRSRPPIIPNSFVVLKYQQ